VIVKKVLVTVVGGGLVALGAVLMPLPGPGLLVVVAGLGVLATQYEWARRLMQRSKDKALEAQRASVRSPLRCALTLATAAGTIGLGSLMFFTGDVEWPVWDSLIDRLWSPVTGGVLIATALFVIVTTLVALRHKSHSHESAGARRA
jgi:uncharacterized protein (TIGR02611 family)